MLDRDAVALDVCPAHRGRVEQQVDQVVREQVDLVDVEDAAVGGGEQPGLVRLHPVTERTLQIERAHHAVLGRADRQFDQRGRPVRGRAGGRVRTVGAVRVGGGRVAGEAAPAHHGDRRQQTGQRTHHSALGRALLAADQHPADRR